MPADPCCRILRRPAPARNINCAGEYGIMERIQLQYLFKDRPCAPGEQLSDCDSLDIVSGGFHLYGEILWPDGGYTQPRPCVILFHGYPGYARNDDLAHALCRIGCVVLTPHHRGAWGSQGSYLISHCVEDAIALANHVRTPAFCKQYHTDPDGIYLIGHSIGGNTVLNAAKQLPWLRGLVLLAPFDPTRHFREGREAQLRQLLEQGSLLHSDGLEAIFQDFAAHRDIFCFESAFEALKDQNLLFITGSADDCAPAQQMVLPLWRLLQSHKTTAVQRFLELPAGHGLMGCRMALIEEAARFLSDTLA